MGDRKGNFEAHNPRPIDQPLGMIGQPEDFTAIRPLTLEHAGRVMERVREEASRGSVSPGAAHRKAPLLWFLRPRRIMISPLGLCASGLAIILIFAGGAWILRYQSAHTHTSHVPVHESVSGCPVLFTVGEAPASRVSIVGDFNNWDPSANPLHRMGPEGRRARSGSAMTWLRFPGFEKIQISQLPRILCPLQPVQWKPCTPPSATTTRRPPARRPCSGSGA